MSPTILVVDDNKELVALLKKDPGNVKWAGGSKGSTDHIGIIAVARDAGVDSNKVNYVPFGGGGEVVSALLGGHVTVATGGLRFGTASVSEPPSAVYATVLPSTPAFTAMLLPSVGDASSDSLQYSSTS